ncbi:GntR family transcriptional regulator [Micrococcoides hystricis]|uniref:GntR family transcriptional regulator n=1 Tax=Micrococcoides hystricis TaxID=1572761 RepID=A0ABV6P9U7_9MICC
MTATLTTMPQWGVSSTSMADRAYGAVKEKLVLLQIQPGSPINESELASELGVGRTPIREALKRLEMDHLVVSYPRRGTFATTVDIAELAEITELRLALEPLAARAAADRATPTQRHHLAEIRDLVTQLTAEQGAESLAAPGLLSSEGTQTLLRLDVAVHHGIYTACGNTHLADVLARYHYLATRIWTLAIHRIPGLATHFSDHVDLLESIIAGDGDAAAATTIDHIEEFERSLRSVF